MNEQNKDILIKYLECSDFHSKYKTDLSFLLNNLSLKLPKNEKLAQFCYKYQPKYNYTKYPNYEIFGLREFMTKTEFDELISIYDQQDELRDKLNELYKKSCEVRDLQVDMIEKCGLLLLENVPNKAIRKSLLDHNEKQNNLRNEIMGEIGEYIVSKFLNKNNLEFMYIRQSNNYHTELSKCLVNNQIMNTKHPDFFVFSKDVGSFFVDVKTIMKLGMPDDSNKYFYIEKNEYEKYKTLEKIYGIKVFLFFIDRNSIENDDASFSIYSLSWISDKLIKDNDDILRCKFIRLPNLLLTNISEEINVDVLLNSISDANVESGFIERLSRLQNSLEQEVFDFLQKPTRKKIRTIKKENIAASFCKIKKYSSRVEISRVVENLVQNKKVNFDENGDIHI